MSCFNRFLSKSIDNAYFVGANTPDGFKCDFSNFFSDGDCKKIFIIKGGSGTGKSTVMRRIAAECERAGIGVEYLLCGSDPESLDGVLFRKDGVRIAIADGTAPHTLDPALAGAVSEIFNSGDCWNTEYLEDHVGDISSIVKEKGDCYGAAYRYISAAAEAEKMAAALARRVLMQDKTDTFAARFAASVKPHGKTEGDIIPKRTFALSMKGAVRLATFDSAERLIGVEDCAGVLPLFMKCVSDALVKQGCDVTVSLSPFGDIWEIYVPSRSVAVVPRREGCEYFKNINLRRFVDKEEAQKVRQKRRFAEKCADMMLDGALESLGDAWRLHSELEKIYVGAMDFSALDAMTENLSRRVLKYFGV